MSASEALMLHLARMLMPCLSWLACDPDSDLDGGGGQPARSSVRTAWGGLHWVGHAHLDLAWLWPVADTWQAAERTFRSARFDQALDPELRFAHSTPALYAWVQRHRPSLFARIHGQRQGRWEPINGPWVETDCVLVSTASLWQQFAIGRRPVAVSFRNGDTTCWLPDSFGFAAGLPAVAQQAGVRWFLHLQSWPGMPTPFPHRLFRVAQPRR